MAPIAWLCLCLIRFGFRNLLYYKSIKSTPWKWQQCTVCARCAEIERKTQMSTHKSWSHETNKHTHGPTWIHLLGWPCRCRSMLLFRSHERQPNGINSEPAPAPPASSTNSMRLLRFVNGRTRLNKWTWMLRTQTVLCFSFILLFFSLDFSLLFLSVSCIFAKQHSNSRMIYAAHPISIYRHLVHRSLSLSFALSSSFSRAAHVTQTPIENEKRRRRRQQQQA